MAETAEPDWTTDEARWAAVCRRDGLADGRFFTAVRTTGVYCKPSCAGRPKRVNVQLFSSAAEARAGGFRACKRCHPDQ